MSSAPEQESQQPSLSSRAHIRLPPPAPVPLAYHATLMQGPEGLLHPAPPAGQSSPQLASDSTAAALPFPQQPRRQGQQQALDPQDCLSNAGQLPLRVLPSATSASLPRVASGAGRSSGGTVGTAGTASPRAGAGSGGAAAGAGRGSAVAKAAAATAGAAAPGAEGEGGSSGQQTETRGALPGGRAGSAEDAGEESPQHRHATSQGRCRSRSTQPAASGPRKSKYRGVQWERSCNKWRARIHTDKTRHIGYFDDEAAAAQAWDLAALRHFGLDWQTKLNFPDESVVKFQAEQAAAAAAPAAKVYRGVQQVDNKFKAVVQKQRTQIVVGVYDSAEAAARAYDRESLRLNGRGAITNFPLSDYAEELERWQEAYNLVTSCDLGALALAQAPSGGGAQPSTTHPFSTAGADGGGRAPGGGGGLENEASMGARDELAGFAAGGRAAAGLWGAAGELLGGGGSKKRRLDGAGAEGHQGLAMSPFARQASLSGGAAGATGVVKVGERYQAYLAVDLGTFNTLEEAAKAHDRAALRVHGFGSRLNAPLEAVMDEAQAACVARRMSAAAQQAQQQRWDGGEAPAPAGYKGTVLREGAFLALLDIEGSQYELGPFNSQLEAAQAHDRYSILLHGLSAQTNFPQWTYLAPDKEVIALVDAVNTVAQNRRWRGGAGAHSEHQQAQQEMVSGGGSIRRGSPLTAGGHSGGTSGLQDTMMAFPSQGAGGLLSLGLGLGLGPASQQGQQQDDGTASWAERPFRSAVLQSSAGQQHLQRLPPARQSHPPPNQRLSPQQEGAAAAAAAAAVGLEGDAWGALLRQTSLAAGARQAPLPSSLQSAQQLHGGFKGEGGPHGGWQPRGGAGLGDAPPLQIPSGLAAAADLGSFDLPGLNVGPLLGLPSRQAGAGAGAGAGPLSLPSWANLPPSAAATLESLTALAPQEPHGGGGHHHQGGGGAGGSGSGQQLLFH